MKWDTLLIAGTSFAIVLVEITLVRVFSFRLWHHLVGLAVALPFLGFGGAGSILAVTRLGQRGGEDARRRFLTRCTVAFALLVGLALWAVGTLDVDVLALSRPAEILKLLALVAVTASPFLAVGFIVCDVLAHGGARVGRLYAADLAGAALACGLAVLVLGPLGAPGVLVAAAAVALVAAIPAAAGRARLVVVGLLVVCLAALATGAIPDLAPAPGKQMASLQRRGTAVDTSRWGIICRIDVTEELRALPDFGGVISPHHMDTGIDARAVYQDGSAPTVMIRDGGRDPASLQWAGWMLQALPYQLRPSPEVAVVGAGGGPDVAIALHHGARRTTAIELNPVTVDLMTGKYAEYTGNLFLRPDVELVQKEGRHFFASTDRTFDVIQLSGVDTYTAASTGTQAMAESYLYTVEGLADLYRGLKPDGLLSYSRWLFDPPRESLRLVVTMRQMLEEQGITDPDRRVLVVAGGSPQYAWADIMLRRGPFTPEEINAARRWAEEQGFRVLYTPDSPREESLFAAALKVPRERLPAFVDAYWYDVRPSRDDSPFFFNFYRLERLLSGEPIPAGVGGHVTTNRPTGLVLQVVTLGVVVVLALALILSPLLLAGKRPDAPRGRGRRAPLLLYFGGLGLGFILFELALIQRLMVALGGPVPSLAVVLFGLLLSTAAGAALSARARLRALPLAYLPLAASAVILVVGLLLGSPLLDAIVALPGPARVLAALALIAPAGVALGMPFPLGLHALRDEPVAASHWAWAINGCLTVVGSALAGLLALAIGFASVLLLAATAYLVAALAGPRLQALPAAPPAAAPDDAPPPATATAGA